MQSLWRSILDFLLPPICPVTQERVAEPGLLSPSAWEALRFIEKPWCPCCGVPQAFILPEEGHGAVAEHLCAICLTDPPPFDAARAAWAYDDASAPLILRFKHGDALQLVRTFTPALQRALLNLPNHPSVIIPVPLHRWRLLRRLYNQAALLAAGLAKVTPGARYEPDVLRRVKSTKSQGHMNAPARAKNVKNAFEVPEKEREKIAGKNVLLIDDVYTTGATIRECARVVKAAGAARVDVLTLARVVREA